jgi:hypothetical protein
MTTNILEDLIGSDDKIVKTTAVKLKAYQGALEMGEMSKAEYDELIADLLDLSGIDHLASDLERKTAIRKAFETMLSIASVVA